MAEVQELAASSSLQADLPSAYVLERSKHLVKKLGTGLVHIWAANIVYFGRSKFLGYFNSYEVCTLIVFRISIYDRDRPAIRER